VIFRPNVQFRSGFPDDTKEDDDGTAVWPGRNITEALKAALERLGYRVSEPISAEHAGWELDVWRERKSLWLRVNVVDADECYLMATSSSGWLWPEMKPIRMFLADLQRILNEDGRFDVVGWLPTGGSAGTLMPWRTPFEP
jgi:hypothetical protein